MDSKLIPSLCLFEKAKTRTKAVHVVNLILSFHIVTWGKQD